MSTATEISRLTAARNTIRDKLIELGLATSTAKLDALATAVDNIVNRGAVSAQVQEGDTYTIPAGYHNGSGTVSGVSGGGNYTLQSKNVTPTKSQQSVTPDTGYYGLSDVTVAAIPEAYQNVSGVTASAGDVLSGKVIVTSNGTVTAGTMTNNGAVNKILDATSGNQEYTVPAGYHTGAGKVKIALETKDVTATEASQTITPTSGKVIGTVNVSAIPSSYVGSKYSSFTGEAISYGAPSSDAITVTFTEDIYANSGSSTEISVPSTYVGTGIAQNSSGNLTVSGATVTAAAGYYTEAASKTIPSGSATTPATSITANPSIVISDSGLITATTSSSKSITPTVVAGYVSSGTAGTATVSGSATKQLTTQAATTITPSTSSQTVGGAGKYMTGAITVAAIPSAYQDVTGVTASAMDVLSGQVIVGSNGAEITGTMTNRGAVSKTLDATTGNQSYTVPSGYHNGSGTVSIVLETKSATPSTSTQNITPTSGKVLSKVTVNSIPSQYGDTTGDTGVASNVLAGIKVHSISSGSAVAITGSMPNNGAISGSIDGLTVMSYSVPSGYTTGGSVALTSDIENALSAI